MKILSLSKIKLLVDYHLLFAFLVEFSLSRQFERRKRSSMTLKPKSICQLIFSSFRWNCNTCSWWERVDHLECVDRIDLCFFLDALATTSRIIQLDWNRNICTTRERNWRRWGKEQNDKDDIQCSFLAVFLSFPKRNHRRDMLFFSIGTHKLNENINAMHFLIWSTEQLVKEYHVKIVCQLFS